GFISERVTARSAERDAVGGEQRVPEYRDHIPSTWSSVCRISRLASCCGSIAMKFSPGSPECTGTARNLRLINPEGLCKALNLKRLKRLANVSANTKTPKTTRAASPKQAAAGIEKLQA